MLGSQETVPRRRRTPSFSSSLLDAVYRSIDDSKSDHKHSHKKQSKNSSYTDRDLDFNFSFNINSSDVRRAMMIESWVEKQSVALSNSASSSSDQSVWSSSEAESKKAFKCSSASDGAKRSQSPSPSPRPRQSSTTGFSKTKLRAMKLYGELKKVKQPISPGGRIASFLNSIFSSGGGTAKKAKMCYVGAVEDVVAASTSENVAKSCLSKPRAGAGAGAGAGVLRGDKRSVRFYPVSVVLGEDAAIHDHHGRRDRDRDKGDPCLMPLSSVGRSFEKKKSGGVRRFCDDHDEADDEDDGGGDDDDDDLSCSSSDLFEIDHLVGVGRYREELPVYETTSLKTNQAIANGLIL